MGFLQSLSRWKAKTADSTIAFTSGQQPVKALDTPNTYRLILVLGIAAVIGSGWFVLQTIKDVGTPFAYRNNNTNQTNTSAALELAKLREKDTDEDGLSDYDELLSYSTSPYLKDSDSDGQTDAQEIEKGTDPNCPAGEACSGQQILTTPTDATGALTPDFLRQALREAGVAQATLDELSNDDLLRLYQNVLQENTDENTNTATTPTLEDLNNLTAAEIRQLLISSGVDAATLQSVDDATLQEIFSQGLNSGS
jgi:hypothetical protein